MAQPPQKTGLSSSLSDALAACRGALLATAIFSGVLNILALAGSIYMLQVYDRVLTSRSVATLIGLTLLLLAAFLVQGALDAIRQKLLTRVASVIDRKLAPRVHDLTVGLPVRVGGRVDPLQPSRDLDSIRAFAGSLGPTALFDLPWMPLFVIICYIMHPWIGYSAIFGCVVLMLLTLISERRAVGPMKDVARELGARASVAEAARRNAETIAAMGMRKALGARYETFNDRFLSASERASDGAATIGSISRIFRMFMQSAVLGLGAYLVLSEMATPGVMIAASILVGRALAPIDTAVAHWRGFVAARQGWKRLSDAMNALPVPPEPMPLPPPQRMLTADQIFTGAPGSTTPIIQGVSISLLAGQALGVIGPSASGKSTLVRTLCGAWTPMRGSVRLDGAEITQWSDEARGAFIGYLPQDIALFDGTVAENIARFRTDADPAKVVAAARAAGADEMIRGLPDGFETRVGDAGVALSGGQRQRVALARALYDDPFLVVLDEPNANLDAEGEAAVTRAIAGVRERGGIVVVVAHRPSAIGAVDMVAFMREGRLQAFGPRDEVLKKVLSPQSKAGVTP